MDSPSTSSAHTMQDLYSEGMDPALCSGPPSGPPFQSQGLSNARLSLTTAVSQSGLGPVPASFIAPSPATILNYSPVQQFPGVGPAVTMVNVSTDPGSLPLNPLATVTAGAPGPLIADPMLLAAAAQAGQDHSFTSVRGGVTYFNPTAQNFLPQRQVINKRPKAAIAIVDPSNMQRGDSIPREERVQKDVTMKNGLAEVDSLPNDSESCPSDAAAGPSELTADQQSQ